MALAALSILAAYAAWGCRESAIPIKQLLDDPVRFDGTSVRIVGEVTGSAGIFGYGAYQVRDDTGTLVVVSEKGGAPREGARVAVDGTFRAVFTFKTESIAVLEESRRRTE